MKRCKQCGAEKPDQCFRQYPPRGNGIRKTTQGRFPTCKDCEAFNRHVNAAWKADPRTKEQEELVTAAIAVYKSQMAKGLHPIGPLAKSLQSEPSRKSTNVSDYLAAYIAENGPSGIVESEESRSRTRQLIELKSVPLSWDNYDEYDDRVMELDAGKGNNTDEQLELLKWHEDRLNDFKESH